MGGLSADLEGFGQEWRKEGKIEVSAYGWWNYKPASDSATRGKEQPCVNNDDFDNAQ